ncbi:MAG TPA: CehA/McbA family metallohydrolase [Steroidobacteraceae bacterium]|nr:CehA/McbA family metallohydrolase [Steroidobacteraceae bacterium]
MKLDAALPALLALCALGAAELVDAQVHVLMGPTPIPNAAARAAGDITVSNEKLAFALAVQSPPPYGVPRGALVALAPVSHGHIGRNRVVFADFIPNNWAAWPNTYQHVEVLDKGPEQVRVRAERDWGAVRISTVYTLHAKADRIELTTTMSNEGNATLSALLSGFTLWPNSGFLFPVPGLAGLNEGKATDVLAPRVSAYDRDWAVTLHAPYLDYVGSGSRDLLLQHALKPKESRTFSAWLQVGSSGDLAPVVAEDIEEARLPAGDVHGNVTSRDGAAVAESVVMVEKDGKPYAWTLGHGSAYRLRLPAAQYTLYATGRAYSRSPAQNLSLAADRDEVRNFTQLDKPGRVAFAVADADNGGPLDARITIKSGDKPPVEFLGRSTFFTELERRGQLSESIAPGEYRFAVSAGGGFLARDAEVDVSVKSGQDAQARVGITPLIDPPGRGWYAADLHHHADQAEAVTPPADLVRSQLAAGLNVIFVSDHDSTANLETLAKLAHSRGLTFLPGIELSPSWGHFNAYPVKLGARLAIDPGTAAVGDVIKEARRLGASVVQVNHPFIPYGYFTSVAAGVAPGGFNGGFDLVEINSTVPRDDVKVLQRVWQYWNEGHRYYLSGGSDTHDVWNDLSGRVRTFVHVEGELSAASFAQSLKAGHAYVSYGPVIFPSVMFGSELKVEAREPFVLGFDLAAVAGLKRAELVSSGVVKDTRLFEHAPLRGRAQFSLITEHPAWYALVVEDAQGRKAYSDPIWVTLETSAPGSAH